jgi:hypothetical protein
VSPTSRQARWLRRGQLGSYILIVAVVALGFWAMGRVQADLCRESYVNRIAIRDLSGSIADLGQRLVVHGKAPITREQKRTLRQFREFERDQKAALALPTCQLSD